MTERRDRKYNDSRNDTHTHAHVHTSLQQRGAAPAKRGLCEGRQRTLRKYARHSGLLASHKDDSRGRSQGAISGRLS
eukprot:3778033-Pleurochrysis_carterae.AAC.1